MADGVEATEELAPDATSLETDALATEAPAEEAGKKDAAAEAQPKQTKTLLSDDEGDGSDDKEPVEYEFTAPEGFDLSEETQTRLDGFKEAAASLGLSQEQFQGVIDYNLESGQQAQAIMADAYIKRIESWGEEVKADKELGGDNLQANLGAIKKVTDAYSDDSFVALIKAPSADNPEGLGLGSHPAFLRFLHRVSKSLTEAEIIEGTDGGPSTDDAASLKRLYPTMFNA
jgi:hypothetical protein